MPPPPEELLVKVVGLTLSARGRLAVLVIATPVTVLLLRSLGAFLMG